MDKLFAFVLSVLFIAGAAFAVDISSCQTLNQPNTIYALTQDVASNGTCFTVAASNVALDCQGHKVIGANNSNFYGLYSNRFNTTVKNCNISNFSIGIYFDGATKGTIDRNNVSTTYSFWILKGNAILLSSSSGNTISNSIATSLTGMGIRLNASSGNTISNSAGTSTFHSGIYFGYSSNNMVSNSEGTSISGVGLSHTYGSNNKFTNVTGVSNTSNGIFISSSSDSIFSNSAGSSVSGIGIYMDSSHNITIANSISNSTSTIASHECVHLHSSSSITIANSTLTSKSSVVLYLDWAMNNNSFYNNTLVSMNGTSALLYVYSLSSNNTFYWNNFTNTSGLYIQDTSGGNFYNTTINGRGEGNIYANVQSGEVQVLGAYPSAGFQDLFIGTSGAGVPYTLASSQGKISGSAVDYAPLTPMPAVQNNITVSCNDSSLVGDANGDGAINSIDALMISKVFVGQIPMPANICCLDVNNDANVNTIDSLLTMKYFANMPPYGNAGLTCEQVNPLKNAQPKPDAPAAKDAQAKVPGPAESTAPAPKEAAADASAKQASSIQDNIAPAKETGAERQG